MRQAFIFAVLAAGCAAAAPAPEPVPASAPATAPVVAGRAGLEIPEDLWDAARAGLGRPGARIGFDSDQMANFTGGRKHILPAVDNLFRDARNLPRFSGNLADKLIAAAPKPDEVVQIAFGLTDAVAGRMLPLPDLKEGWGVGWIPAGTGPDQALEILLGRATGEIRDLVGFPVPMKEEDRRAWALLPPEVKRLAIRLCIAAVDAGPWVLAGVGGQGSPLAGNPTNGSLLRSAVAPLVDERLGQSATLRAGALSELDRVDRNYLAFGSVLLLARVRQALDEYATAEKHPVPAEFKGCCFLTEGGSAWIHDPGPQDMEMGPALLLLDLGGDDRLQGNVATPSKGPARIGLAVDLGGDDVYDATGVNYGIGTGVYGVGALFDLAGNDTYRCKESGLGCGWFGTGVLFDAAGNDTYETATHWGQGCGYAGVGVLIDLAGDDRYTIGYEGQGYGATLGAGILLDVAGNDTYLARDDGNKSDLYLGQTVSMAQGVGQGRRADLGDGHSMAGGFGVLVDGAGDDSYHAGAWSHGAGYWWACGVLEDLGGDDTYYDGKYSLGAGAHFALGVQVDLSGDDAYNVGNTTAVNQYQGHARDGSIGVSVDGDGNDRYNLRSHCGGSADLDSIAVFYDRRGDDVYDATSLRQGEGEGWPDTPPLGTSTRYDPMRSFRDDLDTLGIFLDGGGRDEYRGGPEDWGNGRIWKCRRGPRFLGVGIDRD